MFELLAAAFAEGFGRRADQPHGETPTARRSSALRIGDVPIDLLLENRQG